MSDVAADSPAMSPSITIKGYRVSFSLSAFLIGLAGVVAIFAILAIWVFLRTDEAYKRHQDMLKSSTVIIEYPVKETHDDMAVVKTAKALPEAPIDGLFEDGAHGLLPIIRKSDGLKPFDAYKRPFESIDGRAKVALVIVDMGLSESTMQNILNWFPADVSLSISPYARKATAMTQMARASGHETWLDLPLESSTYGQTDPGPRAILRNASIEQNSFHRDWLLSQSAGYVGVVLPANHVFAADSTDIKGVLEDIIGRGLGIVDMHDFGSSSITAMAYEGGTPYDIGDFLLDETLSSRVIAQKFKSLELRALQNGKAIGFIRPGPLSLQVARKWMEGIEERGIQLAPLSAVANQ